MLHQYMGRIYKVMAEFEDTPEGQKLANTYMDKTPGASVLEITADGRVILVHEGDFGSPAPIVKHLPADDTEGGEA